MYRVVAIAMLICMVSSTSALSSTISLTVFVNSDATAYIKNTGDGMILNVYEFKSPSGRLDPQGWLNIQEQVAADPDSMVAKYGTGILNVDSVPADKGYVAEATPGPGFELAAGETILLGTPFRDPWRAGFDVQFRFFQTSLLPIQVYDGEIVFVPEPPSGWLAYLAFGLLAVSRKFAA